MLKKIAIKTSNLGIGWRITIFIVFIVVVSIGKENSVLRIADRPVPQEVLKIINETMTGQHKLSNFELNKIALGFDKSVKLTDLKTGEPFEIYKIWTFYNNHLTEDSVPVNNLVRRTKTWRVPVLLNGKLITTFEVGRFALDWPGDFSKGVPTEFVWQAGEFDTINKGHYNEWKKVLDAWPKSRGYHPAAIKYQSMTFFHIPEKGDFNLTPLDRSLKDSLTQAADTSFRDLMSSISVVKYLKAHFSIKFSGYGHN